MADMVFPAISKLHQSIIQNRKMTFL